MGLFGILSKQLHVELHLGLSDQVEQSSQKGKQEKRSGESVRCQTALVRRTGVAGCIMHSRNAGHPCWLVHVAFLAKRAEAHCIRSMQQANAL